MRVTAQHPPYTTDIGLLWPVVAQVQAFGTSCVDMPIAGYGDWTCAATVGRMATHHGADTATRALALAVAEIARRTIGEGS